MMSSGSRVVGVAPLKSRAQISLPQPIPGVDKWYTFPRAPNHMIVNIFLREKGLQSIEIEDMIEWVNVDDESNRSPENLAMNPQGGIPWFQLETGEVISETIAMCEFVNEVMGSTDSLIGKSPVARANTRMWQRRMEEHFCFPAFYAHRFWTASKDCPPNHFMKDFFQDRLNEKHGATLIPNAWKDLCQWARNKMLWLEKVKTGSGEGANSDYICGNEFTIVDIQVYVVLWFFAYEFPYPPQTIFEDLEKAGNRIPWLRRWFDRCHTRTSCSAARADRKKDIEENPTQPKKFASRYPISSSNGAGGKGGKQ